MDLELHWQAPDACPTASEIETDVARIVGASPRAQHRVVVEATVRADRAWTILLHVRSGDDEGERTLEGASCQEVAKGAVLVIALTIDPDIMSSPPPPLPPPLPAPSPPPSRPAPLPAPRALRVVVQATGGVAFWTLPGGAFVGSVSGGLRLGRAAAHAGLSLFPFPSSQTIDTNLGAGGSFWLLGLHLRGCGEPIALGRFEVWGCVGLEADRMAATGFGVTDPSSGEKWWGSVLVAPEPAFVLARWVKLVLPLELAVPLVRPIFNLIGVGHVFQPPEVGLRVALGAELSF